VKPSICRQLRLVALVCFFALPAASIDLVGATRATFQWTPSTGDVDVFGYEVYVERNGGPRINVELVAAPLATVEAQYGDQIAVSVRAVGFDGPTTIYSPFSNVSEPVRLLEPPRFGGDGTLALHCVVCSTVEFHSIATGDNMGEMNVPTGSWRIIDAGDADGDGLRDLIWRDEDTGALLVLMVSDFALAGGAFSTAPDMTDRDAVGSGDFDGDGAVEIVLQDLWNGAVEHWQADGTQLLPISTIAGEPGHDLVAVDDFNGDQLPDLLWMNPQSGAVRYWRMQGFAAADVVDVATQASPDLQVVGTGDYNGDGSVDVLWRDARDGTLVIWYLQSGQLTREVALPRVPGDDALEVAGSADFTGAFGEEIVLQHRVTGEVTILFPFSEYVPSRLRIATPGARWMVVDVAN